MSLPTEISFTLPRGYVDMDNRLHQIGRMRAATALDEIAPNSDPKVRENPAYATILVLARVITKLGELSTTHRVVEQFYASDIHYLEDLYLRLNTPAPVIMNLNCPACQTALDVEVAPLQS